LADNGGPVGKAPVVTAPIYLGAAYTFASLCSRVQTPPASEREFIDYKTSMITDEAPPAGVVLLGSRFLSHTTRS